MKMISPKLSILSSAVLALASVAFAAGGNAGFATGNVNGAKTAIGTQTTGGVADPGEGIRDSFAQSFPTGGLHDIKGVLRRVYGTTFSTGSSPSESADKFMQKWSMLWKVPYSQLEKVGPTEDGAHTQSLVADDDGENTKFTVAYFRQHAKGVPVFQSYGWGLVRNEDNFPMVLGGGTLRDIGNMEARMEGVDIDPSSINLGAISGQALSQFSAPPEMSTPRYVIWSGLDQDVQASKLAVEFKVISGQGTDDYQKVLFVVDASNGNILYQESLIYHGSVNVQVNEYVTSDFRADSCGVETTRAMPYAKVVIGSTTLYTDVNGALTYTYSGTGSVTVAPTMGGKYFTVTAGTGTLNTVPSQTVADGGTATFLFNPSAANAALSTAQTNCYEAANKTRDLCLLVSPNFPVIKNQTGFIVRPNLNGTCNAYYDGSINFYLAGGGCNNTGFSSVAHHEYGHHLVNSAGSGQNEYGEGMGDVISVLLTDSALLGQGFQSCTTGLRNASNTCQYSSTGCSSCGSAIHSCGQLLSGCVWDLRNSFAATYPSDYKTRLASYAVNAMPLHAGSSTIQNDIVIDYLTLDDNNGNLGDGSPNYFAIAAAFNKHGLTAPALSLFTITAPNGAPTTVLPLGGTTMDVTITPVTGTVAAGSQKLFYKESSASTWSSTLLTSTGGNNYLATFPSFTCNTSMQFYLQATSTGGTPVTLPTGGATAPYVATAAISSATLIADTFDGTSTLFTIGAPGDNATTGTWVRNAVLNGCGANTVSYSGTKAFVTANGSCVDVDGGKTSFQSPIVDASSGDTVELSYAIFLSYNGATPSNDPLEVFVSNDGGSTWVLGASYTAATGANTWVLKKLNVINILPITSQMRVKFVAQDNGTDNVVEAGIDSVTFTSVKCLDAVFGDFNGDRLVDSSDVSIMLLDFGPCGGCITDLDGSGEVDASDVSLELLEIT